MNGGQLRTATRREHLTDFRRVLFVGEWGSVAFAPLSTSF
jgi:hypothetical protein